MINNCLVWATITVATKLVLGRLLGNMSLIHQAALDTLNLLGWPNKKTGLIQSGKSDMMQAIDIQWHIISTIRVLY